MVFFQGGGQYYADFPTYFYVEFWEIRRLKIPEIFVVIEFITAANQPCDIN